jgi:hypothetical protein
MHHHFNIAYTTGLRVRTALTAAIYRKVGESYWAKNIGYAIFLRKTLFNKLLDVKVTQIKLHFLQLGNSSRVIKRLL